MSSEKRKLIAFLNMLGFVETRANKHHVFKHPLGPICIVAFTPKDGEHRNTRKDALKQLKKYGIDPTTLSQTQDIKSG